MGQFLDRGSQLYYWLEPWTAGKSLLAESEAPKFQENGLNAFTGRVSSKTSDDYYFQYSGKYKQAGKRYPNVRGYAPGRIELASISGGAIRYIRSDGNGRLWLSTQYDGNIDGTPLGEANSIKVLNVGMCGAGGGGGPGSYNVIGAKSPGGGGGGGATLFAHLALETTPKPYTTPNNRFLDLYAGVGGARESGWDTDGHPGGDSTVSIPSARIVLKVNGGSGGIRGRNEGNAGSGGNSYTCGSHAILHSYISGGDGGVDTQPGKGASIYNCFQSVKYFGIEDKSFSGTPGTSATNVGGGGGACAFEGKGGGGGYNDGNAGTNGAGGGGGGNQMGGGLIGAKGGDGRIVLYY